MPQGWALPRPPPRHPGKMLGGPGKTCLQKQQLNLCAPLAPFAFRIPEEPDRFSGKVSSLCEVTIENDEDQLWHVS
jgi:hypothetical protein